MRGRVVLASALCVTLLAAPFATAPAAATESVVAARVAGADRYETAAEVASEAFPDGAATAVLARGDAFPDALAGSFLAGHVDGPVLLTPRDVLAGATSDALQALGADTVHVLGGTGAVSKSVVDGLVADGYDVIRIAGPNRYATAAKIAVAAADSVGTLDDDRTAIVANGAAFPDALAAGPVSFAAGLPILLTPAAALDSATAAALSQLEIGHVLVLGGPAAVSDEVVASIEETGATTERLAGDDRAATAAAVAGFAVERLAWSGSAVALARGDAFPDGLAGGPFGGRTRAPILLTDPAALSPATAGWLTEHADTVARITALGGKAAVSDSALDEARVAVGAPSSSTFAVGGGRTVATIGVERTCTVTTPGRATVELRVLPAANVTDADGGQPTFADAQPDGVADEGAVAVISTVNGRTQSPPSARVGDVDSDGSFDVVLRSDTYASVLLVAFTDAEGGAAGALDVDESGAPTDEVAVGCRTVFAPAEAPQGSRDGAIVHSVDVNEGLFVADGQTFFFDAEDTYQVEGAASTVAEFEALLSQDDELDILSYVPGGASSFAVATDTVLPVLNPVGVVAARDVTLSFTIPESNGDGTTYRVTRLRTHAIDDGCSSNIAQTATTVGVTVSSPYQDGEVADGCYIYRILSVASSGTIASSVFSPPVKVPGTPPAGDTIRPVSNHASVTEGGNVGFLGNGDTATIAFSEPLATTPPGASMTVTSGGATATFTSGSNATFSLNSASTIVGGQTRAPRTVLTVLITSDPTSPIALPAQVTSSGGVNDVAGNAWDVVGSSDRALKVTS